MNSLAQLFPLRNKHSVKKRQIVLLTTTTSHHNKIKALTSWKELLTPEEKSSQHRSSSVKCVSVPE